MQAAAICDLLQSFDAPATWALNDPANSRWAERLATTDGRHEIALLTDGEWQGDRNGRSRFAATLIARLGAARKVGFQVATLVVHDASCQGHEELLVKHGVRAVRDDRVAAAAGVRPLRFGLWQFAAQRRLPENGRRWLVSQERQVRRAVDQAAAKAGVCHLAIDVDRFDDEGRAIRALEHVLHHADKLRREGSLRMETIASAVERFDQPRRRVAPAQSILRRAA